MNSAKRIPPALLVSPSGKHYPSHAHIPSPRCCCANFLSPRCRWRGRWCRRITGAASLVSYGRRGIQLARGESYPAGLAGRPSSMAPCSAPLREHRTGPQGYATPGYPQLVLTRWHVLTRQSRACVNTSKQRCRRRGAARVVQLG